MPGPLVDVEVLHGDPQEIIFVIMMIAMEDIMEMLVYIKKITKLE